MSLQCVPYSIFYDLETTDLSPIGQIFDFSFILVDPDWKTLDKLSASVQLNRLQLPSPQSIAVTRLDPLEHQDEATYTEKQALLKIHTFIQNAIDKYSSETPQIAMVGYNNNRFDLHFLRTSLVRNGLNPYFGKNLRQRDVIHVVNRLALSSPKFHTLLSGAMTESKLSFRLESVAQKLGLFLPNQTQSHKAEDDALLTMDLAFHITQDRDYFNLDVRTYEAYEVEQWETAGNTAVLAECDREKIAYGSMKKKPYIFLMANNSHSLWLDYEDLQKRVNKNEPTTDWKGSIRYFNKNTSQFVQAGLEKKNKDTLTLVQVIKDAGLLNNGIDGFFQERNCDIELDIYSLKFEEIDILHDAIWKKDLLRLKKMKGDDSKVRTLLTRHAMANHVWGKDELTDAKYESYLKRYAIHRYGSEMIIEPNGTRHPSLYKMIEDAKNIANATKDPEIKNLMVNLLCFYGNSDIYKVAGEELLSPIHEIVKPEPVNAKSV